MTRLYVTLIAVVALLANLSTASAFEPPHGAELVKKVRKSVIRVENVSVDSPFAFSAGYGGGSGVVFQIDYDQGIAYALTNHHVSGDALVNAVRFWDGAQFRAELVAREPGIDAALLKIIGIPDERDLPESEKTIVAAPLGDSDATQIGEYGFAMGAPGSNDGFNTDRSNPYEDFLLQQTVTWRVVSGKTTDPLDYVSNWSGWKNDLGMQVLTNLPWSFMVTVPINGGNSGGPLFNAKGEVIGLNHAGYPAGGAVIRQNENYTIPINFVKNFAYQILNTGRYELPWLGLDMLIPTTYLNGGQVAEWVERHSDPTVLRILDVRPGSPAQQSGFMKDDVILEFDGQTFPNLTDLRAYVFRLPIGKQIPVTVKRAGRKVHLNVEVAPKRHYDAEFSF